MSCHDTTAPLTAHFCCNYLRRSLEKTNLTSLPAGLFQNLTKLNTLWVTCVSWLPYVFGLQCFMKLWCCNGLSSSVMVLSQLCMKNQQLYLASWVCAENQNSLLVIVTFSCLDHLTSIVLDRLFSSVFSPLRLGMIVCWMFQDAFSRPADPASTGHFWSHGKFDESVSTACDVHAQICWPSLVLLFSFCPDNVYSQWCINTMHLLHLSTTHVSCSYDNLPIRIIEVSDEWDSTVLVHCTQWFSKRVSGLCVANTYQYSVFDNYCVPLWIFLAGNSTRIIWRPLIPACSTRWLCCKPCKEVLCFSLHIPRQWFWLGKVSDIHSTRQCF